MGKRNIIGVTAITDIFGEGQKCTCVAIEYDTEIDATSLNIDSFAVEGREIIAVYTNNKATHYNLGINGKFVILELDSIGENGFTKIRHGGPRGYTEFPKATAAVSQKKNIRTFDGKNYEAFPEIIKSNETVDPLADLFKEFCEIIPETNVKLIYQLYVPNDYEKTKKYPLVVFLHDAGSCSPDGVAPLVQGLGAVIWASPDEQIKHKCIVLAPRFEQVCTDDDFRATNEVEYTVELIKKIQKKYSIDEKRIYGTGQSMGCMMLCEINVRYPDLFGGCLLIAGQWNPKTMFTCKNKNFWIVVSQGDRKAFPIMGACVDSMENAGSKVIRSGLNAKLSDDELSDVIEKLEEKETHIYFTWFEGDSILPEETKFLNPMMHHTLTWKRAYYITGLRDWLFRQSL